MLAKANIRAAVDEKRTEIAAKTGLTVEKVVTELANVAFFDLRRALDPDTGRPLEPHKLPPEVARAMASVKVRVMHQDDDVAVQVHEFRPADKIAALVNLGKHLGAFTPAAAPAASENLALGPGDVQPLSTETLTRCAQMFREVREEIAAEKALRLNLRRRRGV